MVGFEMFCERCGKRYGNGEASGSTSLPLSKRLLKAVGVSATAPQAPAEEPLLRFCLACRGYSCAECWNDDAGFCQTCVPVEVPAAELPAIKIPSLEAPTPQMAFAEPSEMPPYLQMLAEQSELPQVDPLADFVVEPVVDADAALAVEVEPVVEVMDEPVLEPMLAFEAEPIVEAMAEFEPVVEAMADVDPVAVEPVAADEAEVVAADLVAAEVVAAAAAETLAMDERPLDLVFADEEMTAEPEPEDTWEWDFVAVTEATPVEAPEPVAEPLAAATEDADTVESGGLVDAPVVPALPQALPPPVYRPLPPLGPIMSPPPPAAASSRPSIDFDILQPPPAFVIAPQQAQALMRPQLPAGLFDGPAPQIRPCHECELPVSAKARFCRRCGSAQPS